MNVKSLTQDCDESTTFFEAVNGKFKNEWREPIKNELEAHKANGTWVITQMPTDGNILAAKWVFLVKRNKDNSIERSKARLVARGCEQRSGLDFQETY